MNTNQLSDEARDDVVSALESWDEGMDLGDAQETVEHLSSMFELDAMQDEDYCTYFERLRLMVS